MSPLPFEDKGVLFVATALLNTAYRIKMRVLYLEKSPINTLGLARN
jgi:hypothetical protein